MATPHVIGASMRRWSLSARISGCRSSAIARTHLRHHDDQHLTHPSLDPESYYLLPDSWARLPAPLRQLYTLNNTLAGRMLLGPVIGIVRLLGC